MKDSVKVTRVERYIYDGDDFRPRWSSGSTLYVGGGTTIFANSLWGRNYETAGKLPHLAYLCRAAKKPRWWQIFKKKDELMIKRIWWGRTVGVCYPREVVEIFFRLGHLRDILERQNVSGIHRDYFNELDYNAV